MKLVIATRNANKIIEIREKFEHITGLEILTLKEFEDVPEVVEDGITFEENALKKARVISNFTGLPALADDSGLEIEALGGEPGIYSARYAGDEVTDEFRNILIHEKMRDVPAEKRGARFICIIAICMPDAREYVVRGECYGIISYYIQGEYGFGYDPIFYLPHMKKTMAQLSLSEKNRISHRAIALEKSIDILNGLISFEN
ncbi:MAG: XTP/dITP diphosphatase [Spirochaetota bacterium]|nr:XTP/dITP diphosphatase [Spirochaetota bacterium]